MQIYGLDCILSAGELAELLRNLAALAENGGLIHRTQIMVHNCNSSPRAYDTNMIHMMQAFMDIK